MTKYEIVDFAMRFIGFMLFYYIGYTRYDAHVVPASQRRYHGAFLLLLYMIATGVYR